MDSNALEESEKSLYGQPGGRTVQGKARHDSHSLMGSFTARASKPVY